MQSKKRLCEVIKREIKGGNPSIASTVRDEQIVEAIGQVLNKLLKVDYLNISLPSGQTIPDGSVLASYDGIVVEKYKDRSRAKLPAIPVMLPNNMGVFHVGDADDPDCYYIPLPAGQGALLKNQTLINDLLGKTAYEIKDAFVVFTKDITGTTEKKVDMQLVVRDMSHYGDYDILPIPADMEEIVVETVKQRFLGAPPPDKQVDSGSEPSKIAR